MILGAVGGKYIAKLLSAFAQPPTACSDAPAPLDSFRKTSEPASFPSEIGPLLKTVRLSEAQKTTAIPCRVLDTAQGQLDEGDRGGAYLTLYREMGNEQLLVQAQITTYTGVWGSGALTGNHMAKLAAGTRYDVALDKFSVEIAQATINSIRHDLDKGGTGRLGDNQLQTADRHVWAKKNMAELFPGNVQFVDFWNHEKGDRLDAIFSPSSWNMVGAAARSFIPNTSLFGLNKDLRNVSNLVGKRPAEYANDPVYTVHGSKADRFITVIDNRNGFIEAFWDNSPRVGGVPMPQLPNRPLEPDSPELRRRQQFYEELGANRQLGGS